MLLEQSHHIILKNVSAELAGAGTAMEDSYLMNHLHPLIIRESETVHTGNVVSKDGQIVRTTMPKGRSSIR